MRTLLARVRNPAAEPVVVKADGRHLFLGSEEIEWVEASGKDVRLHLGKTVLVIRESLSSLERRLDRHRFLRVHRSALVNRSQVKELQPWFKGEYVLILRSGAKVLSGRSYRAAIQRLIAGEVGSAALADLER
jgi:two-component system LytT family response regulator